MTRMISSAGLTILAAAFALAGPTQAAAAPSDEVATVRGDTAVVDGFVDRREGEDIRWTKEREETP